VCVRLIDADGGTLGSVLATSLRGPTSLIVRSVATEDFRERLRALGSAKYTDLRGAQAHVLSAYAQGFESAPDVAIELPTGVGKTLIALLLADYALDRGWSVAYLTGSNVLSEQVEIQARDVPGLSTHRFWGGHYPGAALDDYHQAQAVAIMNYWVYFNASRRSIQRPRHLR